MELYNEDEVKKRVQRKSKLPLIISICIAILIVITIFIIYGIIYLKSTINKITIDGVNVSQIEKILIVEENENGSELYIPIRGIAEYLGYKAYVGDYIYKSEDQTKCYVQNDYEIAMFTLDSNTLIKSRGNSDYDYVEIDEKVFQRDGELYTTIDGIKKAFNVEFTYTPEKRKIEIYTMDYLVTYYAKYLQIEDYSEEFTDKKAIFENMIIVNEDGQYGVVQATTGQPILETKYEKVAYLPNTTDFLVKSNGKYGVVSKNTDIKIKIAYDEIKIMDNKNGLYLVKENNFYGIVDTEGNVILEPEYQQIGISNLSSFSQNGVENQYVLLDKIIPVKSNNLWGFFDVQGQQITEFIYTNVGCTTSKVANSYPVLVLPSYDIVIVQNDKYYNLMKTNGREIVPNGVLDSVYMRTNTATGENTFYMTYNGQTKNIEEELAKQGE